MKVRKRAQVAPAVRPERPRSPFTVRELRHVQLLYESRSFQRAAQRAGISQPALSQSIAAVERRLGVTLFLRTRRSVSPTPYAELIAQGAESVLAAVDRIEAQIDAVRDARRGAIAFGVGILPAARLLGRAMARFLALSPNVRLNVEVAYATELREHLLAGDLEFAVLLAEPDEAHEQLAYEPLYEEPFAFLCRPGHPLARSEPVECSELVRFPVVSYETRLFPRQIQQHVSSAEDAALLDRNVPAISLQRPELLVDFVALSDYVLLGAESSFRTEIQRGALVRFDVRHLRMDTRVALVTRRDRDVSPPSRQMIDALRALAPELGEDASRVR